MGNGKKNPFPYPDANPDYYQTLMTFQNLIKLALKCQPNSPVTCRAILLTDRQTEKN